jgi:hypothetical protein
MLLVELELLSVAEISIVSLELLELELELEASLELLDMVGLGP